MIDKYVYSICTYQVRASDSSIMGVLRRGIQVFGLYFLLWEVLKRQLQLANNSAK